MGFGDWQEFEATPQQAGVVPNLYTVSAAVEVTSTPYCDERLFDIINRRGTDAVNARDLTYSRHGNGRGASR